jgi:alkylation response protein AidB-like acyl-CoA dehydrogenase
MNQVQELHADPNRTGPDEAWVARAKKVAPIIAAAADRIEQEKRVPDDVMSAMHDAQLFRMLLPRTLGGGEVTPRGFMDVMSIIAAADASAAWCLGQALGCSFAAAYLDPPEAEAVFGKPDSVVAWGPVSPNAKAVAVEGGYRLTGRFRFASGSRNATWLGAHCLVVEPDGTPRAEPGGKPVARTFMFPIESAKTHDVWQVMGLKGTGSDDYEVDDLFVPEGYTFIREVEAELRDDWPIYRITFMNIYGIGFAAVSLGIARAMLDEFVTLAAEKIAYRTTAVLRENPVIQTQTAHAEWQLGASRAYLNEMVERHWRTACSGEEFPLDERTRLRLAISYAMNQAREVAEFAFRAAGTNAIFESGPFERRFRDIQAVSQQSQANQWNFISAGEALLGLDPSGGRI